MITFVRERHEAFEDVLYKQDLTKLKRYSKKYGSPMPKSKKIAIAGVMKAIYYCTDFNDEEKTMAMMWCLENGFSPFINEAMDWRVEQ